MLKGGSLTLHDLRYRYLMPDEEPRLMVALTGPRAHLQPIVTVALGTGMRLSRELQMKRHQVDFLRNIVTARYAKNGRPRDMPMNDDVRQALADLCKTNDLTIMCSSVINRLMRSGSEKRISHRVQNSRHWHDPGIRTVLFGVLHRDDPMPDDACLRDGSDQ